MSYSVLLCANTLCQVQRSSYNLTHKLTINVWHILVHLYLYTWFVVIYLNIVSNDERQDTMGGHAPVLVCGTFMQC